MLFNYFLILYIVAFFAIAVGWRTFIVWKRTGKNSYALLNAKGVYGIIGKYFRAMPLLSVSVVITYVFLEQWYHYLAPFTWIEEVIMIRYAGVILLLASFLLIVISQSQMGNSWRIGIDQEGKTDLVINGMFRYSRNPIFFGIIINVAGFFLVLPNAITLLILVLNTALIQIQVALEEKHLRKMHSQSYDNYCSSVRRWV